MQVSLIDFTGMGTPDPARYAAERLVFTKATRLSMTPELMDSIQKRSDEELLAELRYMANTIPSSWEFVNYTFLVNGVTRAFTHQLVRTRTGSYAQQTMRVLDVAGWNYMTGPTIRGDADRELVYDGVMSRIASAYDGLINMGAKIEDARGVLPTNIETNIVAKFDLRTLADTARKRASGRTQGEYRDVMNEMKRCVLEVHPWSALFFNRTFDVAAAELEAAVNEVEGISEEQKVNMIKLIDQMRATA